MAIYFIIGYLVVGVIVAGVVWSYEDVDWAVLMGVVWPMSAILGCAVGLLYVPTLGVKKLTEYIRSKHKLYVEQKAKIDELLDPRTF